MGTNETMKRAVEEGQATAELTGEDIDRLLVYIGMSGQQRRSMMNTSARKSNRTRKPLELLANIAESKCLDLGDVRIFANRYRTTIEIEHLQAVVEIQHEVGDNRALTRTIVRDASKCLPKIVDINSDGGEKLAMLGQGDYTRRINPKDL